MIDSHNFKNKLLFSPIYKLGKQRKKLAGHIFNDIELKHPKILNKPNRIIQLSKVFKENTQFYYALSIDSMKRNYMVLVISNKIKLNYKDEFEILNHNISDGSFDFREFRFGDETETALIPIYSVATLKPLFTKFNVDEIYNVTNNNNETNNIDTKKLDNEIL